MKLIYIDLFCGARETTLYDASGIGWTEWGASSEPVFIIKLGNIVEAKNIISPARKEREE